MVNMAILSAKALPRGHGVRPGVSLNLTRSATKPENQNKLIAFFKKAYSYTLKCMVFFLPGSRKNKLIGILNVVKLLNRKRAIFRKIQEV